MKIITSNIYPPIPDRSHDWGAYYDGNEEDGFKGYGATEAEAIRDLVENHEAPELEACVKALQAIVDYVPVNEMTEAPKLPVAPGRMKQIAQRGLDAYVAAP